MLKKLLDTYKYTDSITETVSWYNGATRNLSLTAYKICVAVQCTSCIRKGQEQMMADYLMLELLEQGRL